MHWLVIIALAGFVFSQGLAIRRLEQRLDAALRATEEHRRRLAAERTAATPQEPAPPKTAPPKTAPQEPAPQEPAPQERPIRKPALSVAAADPAPRLKAPAPVPSESSRSEPRRAAPPRPKGPGLSTWLAENGLAWIGGGGLALGGLLLVVYAAQQGVFTPPFRIAAAVGVGGLMLAASEWILRRPREGGGRHLLAAAVAAGAGAVTLYGAVCAAYALYGLIPFPIAAALTAAISLGLLGLSLRHGEPLALLAVFGAAITPLVTGVDAWSSTMLQAYALFIGVTGLAISAVRLWPRACFVTVAGLLAWSVALRADGAALVLLAAAGPFAAALRLRPGSPEDAEEPRRLAFLRQPTIALALASLASIPLWFGPGFGFDGQVDLARLPVAAALSVVLVALGAAMVALRRAPALVFAAPVAAAAMAVLLALAFYGRITGFGAQLPWLYAVTALIPVAAFAAALRSTPAARTVLLGVGGLGVAVLASLSWLLLDDLGVTLAWLPPALLGSALFAAAGVLVARTDLSPNDRGLVLWLAAAAELSFLAVHAASPAAIEPVGFAAAALILAAATRRLAWPGLARTAVAGSFLALATVFRPGFIGAALGGQLSLVAVLAATAAATVLLFVGARVMRGAARSESEAQATAALMVLVAGLFIALHQSLSGIDAGAASGVLFEAAVRTLVLLAAGLLLTVRQTADDGPIALWRMRLVIGAGVVHGLIAQGLLWNPWWGAGAPPFGLPLLNGLLIAFAAPAVLLAAAAWRQRPVDAWARAWAAAAAAFAVLWALLAIRHGFHGAAMGEAGIGPAEAGAYALLALLTARALGLRPAAAASRSSWLNAAAVPAQWAALAIAALTFGYFASPWWGPITTPMATASVVLLFVLYGGAAAALSDLGRSHGRLGQTARAVSVGVLFALLTLLIRWSFHGGEMGGQAPGGGLETWTFSALWAAFGLVTLSLGTARRDIVLRWAGLAVLLITAAKVLLFDLARLEGVIRAASFLAVGALFLAGALAARRLNAPEPRTQEAGEDVP